MGSQDTEGITLTVVKKGLRLDLAIIYQDDDDDEKTL